MDESRKIPPDETITTLRALAHDLSNAIENIMQGSYLLGQTPLDDDSRKWLALIDQAANEAATLNREIREILKSQH